MIDIYITKKSHYKYNYLANWISIEGIPLASWFVNKKELEYYFKEWGRLIYTN